MGWRKVFGIVGIVVAAEIVLFVVGFVVVVYSGIYNVAATKPEPGATDWVLSTTMDRSVHHHAAGIRVSATYESPDPSEGYEHFSEMCVACHGAPGIEPSEMGKGLNPRALDLSEAANEWTPSEVYWIVKNGIKMSGMPAFGPTHDDEKLWNITAFVKRLPGLAPEQDAMRGKATEAHTTESEHAE